MLDILIFGATGVTGRLTAIYLANHSERASFTFAIAGRSKDKLEKLATELSLPDLPLFIVDAHKKEEVEQVVSKAKPRVIINTVGPFWRWGPAVLDSCLHHGVHYLDFGGTLPWMAKLVHEYDYVAMKAGIIIIPACAYFTLPSDIAAYVSGRTLDSASGQHIDIDTSISGHQGALNMSGGTFASLIAEGEDHAALQLWRKDHPLSPVPGFPLSPKLTYDMKLPDQHFVGVSDYFTHAANRATVERSWGLRELYATHNDVQATRYGPTFKYDEFSIASNRFLGILTSRLIGLVPLALSFRPLRWVLKLLGPKPGDGPSPSALKNGWFKVTNLTTSASQPPVQVKTVIEGKGDPGYLLSSHMIAEAALAIVVDNDKLPELGKRGGVLTPSIALGDVLVERLKKSGLSIESSVISAV